MNCDTTDRSEDAQTEIAFPEGYRNWAHVKTTVVLEGHPQYNPFGGIHHVYANDKALKALKDSTSFEKGSILIFDLMEETIVDNALIEGPRKWISVMVKDQDQFPETGGWGFEEFKKNDHVKRTVINVEEQCFSCHKTQEASDFVFSKYRK